MNAKTRFATLLLGGISLVLLSLPILAQGVRQRPVAERPATDQPARNQPTEEENKENEPAPQPAVPRGPWANSPAVISFWMHPVVQILDANRDFAISSAEIENAAKAIGRLDRNNDQFVTPDEIIPPEWKYAAPNVFGPPVGVAPGTATNDDNEDSRGRRRTGRNIMAERLLSFDQDKDGRVTKEEVSPRMHRLFDNADGNNDGVLDAQELENIGTSSSRRGRTSDPPAEQEADEDRSRRTRRNP